MQSSVPGRTPPRLGGERFLIIDTIGDGGTATVYLVWDSRERQWCAMKAIQRTWLGDEEMLRRFSQEADALSRFSHPNIPRLIHQDCQGTPPFMVMELARAGSVMDWVKQHGPMPPIMVADVLFQVCQALEVAHRQGIVHRDVKPHNFLIDDDGVCKLTDFGIARWGHEASMTATGSQIGTFSFMAPEQRSDTKNVDLRADVYSLGATLYTMLTGRTSAELFVAENDDAILADVPTPFRDVILTATRYRAEERYGSATEFQGAVMDALGQMPPPTDNYPPLCGNLEPLPRRPPEFLPAGTVFPELDPLLGIEAPVAAPPAQSGEQRDDRTPATEVMRRIGYRMPQRAQARAPRSPLRAGYIVSDDGATYAVQDPDEITQNIAAQVRAELAETIGSANREEGLIGLGPLTSLLFALSGAVAALLVLVVGGGASWVWYHQMAADDAALTLREALHENGSVVYDLTLERAAIQAAFEAYEVEEGSAQVDAAIAFVDAVEASAAGSERVVAPAQKKLNRLRSARNAYQDAVGAWSRAAAGFPGSVAVRMELAAPPDP